MALTALPVYPPRLRDKSPSRAVEATVYPSGGGTPYTGYVIDGRTYKDPKGQERIDSGSTVELRDGRSYVYDGTQAYGVPSTMSSLSEYKQAMSGAVENYRNTGKRNERAVDIAYAKARDDYGRQKTQAQQRAKQDEASAYMDYLKAQNPYGLLAQRNERLGLGDSGFAETTLERLHSGYMQNVSGIRSKLSQTLSELDGQIARAYYDGELEKARYWQQVEQDILDYTTHARDKLLSSGMDAADKAADNIRYEREWQQKLKDEEYDRKTEQERWQAEFDLKKQGDESDKALALMKMGLSSQQIADALGISLEQARYAAWKAIAPKTTSRSSSSSSSKKTSKDNTETSETKENKTGKLTSREFTQQMEYYTHIKKMLINMFDTEGIVSQDIREQYMRDLIFGALKSGKLTEEFLERAGYWEEFKDN